MRFLCLHGMGTNSSIYEAQLAPIISQLGHGHGGAEEHEFIFLDGTIECPAADEIVATIFPPPFYCYYSKPTTTQLEAAFELVTEFIEDEGPFDGVFGFSQGGALIASMLLRQRRQRQLKGQSMPVEDLFKVAVFTCTSLPFDLDCNDAIVKSQQTAGDGTTTTGLYNTIINPLDGSVSIRNFHLDHHENNTPTSSNGEDKVETTRINGYLTAPEPTDGLPLRRYHPDREPAHLRISIPTVHIIGEKDPFAPQSKALVGLCEDAVVVTHQGGHELPRDVEGRLFAKKAATAISGAVYKALFRC
ncbi:Serine hydrolase FSH [Rhypophila sp. PSN 637]